MLHRRLIPILVALTLGLGLLLPASATAAPNTRVFTYAFAQYHVDADLFSVTITVHASMVTPAPKDDELQTWLDVSEVWVSTRTGEVSWNAFGQTMVKTPNGIDQTVQSGRIKGNVDICDTSYGEYCYSVFIDLALTATGVVKNNNFTASTGALVTQHEASATATGSFRSDLWTTPPSTLKGTLWYSKEVMP